MGRPNIFVPRAIVPEAVELLRATSNHPEAEIDKVTTPGGLTI